ncbi:MAG: PIN domain-containing protein [Micropruina sp.]|uniref:PIN domain-containing protein n=1 Tax=Micropruina sp. TaxID=2737536 RepID=UPI0039E42CB5
MARLPRVFIDTSELFPFTIMDVLLTLSEDFLFTWVWTDEVLAEWEEVIVREGRRTPESAASVSAAVRQHFGRYRIDPALYRDKVTNDLSTDPKDRVHAAAAIHGDVDIRLTVLTAGVKVITSDEFLVDLLKRRRQGVVESFTRAATSKKRPPITGHELADKIAAAGAPRFAERLHRLLGST